MPTTGTPPSATTSIRIPKPTTPIKAFDRSLAIAERVRVAAGAYQAKAGIAGWANLLWNDLDQVHRIREYGQIRGNYWMFRSAAVRRSGQILGITQEVVHRLF